MIAYYNKYIGFLIMEAPTDGAVKSRLQVNTQIINPST